MIDKARSDHRINNSYPRFPLKSDAKRQASEPKAVSSQEDTAILSNPASDLTNVNSINPFDDDDPFKTNNDIRKTAYVPFPEEKEWTILVYMAGDNDLEPYLVKNFQALEKSGSSPNINLVAEFDRGNTPKSPVSKWTGSRRFLITKSTDNKKITSAPVQDLGDVNMADPKHLSDFVQWGVKNYPARHYMLIINDHGYGFMGALDDKGSKDVMDLPEMGKALEMATKGESDYISNGAKDAAAKTGKKIDILGFDACLMGQVEVAYELKDYANIMIASEEVIGSSGWPYGDFADKNSQVLKGVKGPIPPSIQGFLPESEVPSTSRLFTTPFKYAIADFLNRAETIITEKGELTPEAFAVGIIDQCERRREATPTMSAIRLGDYAQHIADAIKELATQMRNTTFKGELLDIINRTQHFNMQAPDQNPYGDYRDIYHFCQGIINTDKITEVKLKESAAKVQKAMDEAIIDRIGKENPSEKHKDSYGLSMYIPDKSGETDFGYRNSKFDKSTGWLDSVRQVAQYDPNGNWDPLYRPPQLGSNKDSGAPTA